MHSTGETRYVIISNLIWKLMERGGTQGVQFVIQLVLARLLLPEDYGLIALIVIFITIANIFVQRGFSTALIQRKDVVNLDLSSVFYMSLFVAGICYAGLYFLAPLIAIFYGDPKLILLLRVLSISLFFGAVNSIQYAIVARNMQFKQLFLSSLIGCIVSGGLSIIMALNGFGVWALVIQQLCNQLIIAIVLFYVVKWRPLLRFSFFRVQSFFSFGWKLLCSSLLDAIYNNAYGLIIGKTYGTEMLAYFSRGDQFPSLLVNNLSGAISSVMMPALSAQQDDKARMKSMVRRSISISSFIVVPMMCMLAVCAESLVRILLTEKWLGCVPFLQIMCLSYVFWPIHTANLQAINALGRSDIFLKLEIAKKFIGVIVLVISLPLGIYTMVQFLAVTSFISTFINAFPNKVLLGYGVKEQWKDTMPPFLLAAIMGGVVYMLKFIGWNDWCTLCIQGVVGCVLYISLARLFRLESYNYLLSVLKQYLIRAT